MPLLDVKTGVVLLAAGEGKRFGGGKLIAEFRGRPLWEWATETAENIDFSERILVIGPDGPIRARPTWRLVENPVAKQGMGTSIAAGIRALTDCDRVIIMLADMPLVSRAHLDRLIAAQGVGFTRYPDGSAGCPAIFPRSVFALLETLDGDRGARSLGLGEVELIAPAHERELADVDEACDLQRLASADLGSVMQFGN
ncbi:nucleotidyltransferase family protein [Alteriqipengyuania flavescens]|uniref:nucleotidyltransferase family protein n=1 Tax=Alteriqipengyuania flavescens TaxID=3053610 RepID=UPI0025B3E7B1|nr:nucleotidyltransferase family protein [Alteriqipengyuania flavescens]WJY17538.1 nucleotidyltransferase family protein [Alteriqipengyuania flavescens]WJY23481.1 nucleotidyltransferase family protein [Alteriqipengyuania flavescens]